MAGQQKLHAVQILPANYAERLTLDLQADKKEALKVNGIGLAVMLVMALGMHFVVPAQTLFSRSAGIGLFGLRLGVLGAAYIAYIVLHEWTHGVTMRHYGAQRVRFGFTGLYAYAGSEEDYFDKSSYRVIALAPMVVWGVIFALLQFAVPREWFWVVWLLQAGNIGGAAGDVYVTVRLWKEPSTILIRDTGVDATVFDK